MGLLDLLLCSCCDTYCALARWLCLPQPWHHHMGTACHCGHHHTCPITFRTQGITCINLMKMLVRGRKK